MSILEKYEMKELDDPESLALLKPFKGHKTLLKLTPGGWIYLPGYKKFADAYKQFEFVKDDVVVATMPKAGTTWLQEIVWTMRNNPDLENSKCLLPLHLRSPNMEVDMTIEHIDKPKSIEALFDEKFPGFDHDKGMFLHIVKTAPNPRTIKIHLPLELLHPAMLDTAKIVYLIRDPRDLCLSYMHHCRIFFYENFEGTNDEYIDAFLADVVAYGPYWAHVSQAWAQRNHPNMHITFYEKLKKNPKVEIERLNKFLDTKLTPDQIDKIIHFTSFAEMKKRKQHCIAEDDEKDFVDQAMAQKDGGFFRQGTAGGWQKALTEEQKERFEKWIEKNCPDKEIMENILNP